MNRLVLALCSLVLVLAACGDDESVAAGDGLPVETDPSTDTDPEPDADPDPDGDPDPDADPDPDGGDDPGGPIQFGSYPVGELLIEITKPDGSMTSHRISCLGDTATLAGDWDTTGDGLGGTAADAMCTRLADPAVQDLLVNGVDENQVCTDQFGSAHVASITGTLDGAEVAVEVDRADGCGIDHWDRLLADVLPAVDA
ncbi:MAG: hypothetical protein AAFN30_14065 [Actinomycetota bacterium]